MLFYLLLPDMRCIKAGGVIKRVRVKLQASVRVCNSIRRLITSHLNGLLEPSVLHEAITNPFTHAFSFPNGLLVLIYVSINTTTETRLESLALRRHMGIT